MVNIKVLKRCQRVGAPQLLRLFVLISVHYFKRIIILLSFILKFNQSIVLLKFKRFLLIKSIINYVVLTLSFVKSCFLDQSFRVFFNWKRVLIRISPLLVLLKLIYNHLIINSSIDMMVPNPLQHIAIPNLLFHLLLLNLLNHFIGYFISLIEFIYVLW